MQRPWKLRNSDMRHPWSLTSCGGHGNSDALPNLPNLQSLQNYQHSWEFFLKPYILETKGRALVFGELCFLCIFLCIRALCYCNIVLLQRQTQCCNGTITYCAIATLCRKCKYIHTPTCTYSPFRNEISICLF